VTVVADESSHTTIIEECLVRLRTGDLSARDALIHYSWRRLHQLVHRFFRSEDRLRGLEETSDLRQNVALRLY
jgi:hypothetical protein